MENFLNECIDSFMNGPFAVLPVVHERTLREHISLVVSMELPHYFSFSVLETILLPLRHYSLLTSIMATTCCVASRSTNLRWGKIESLAPFFSSASRASLRLISELDILAPTSSSLAIRIFQSGYCHLMGDASLAWHIKDEAVRLLLQMRLFDAQSYYGKDPIEAELCRNMFWHLYSSDRSASLLNDRPQIIDEFRLCEPITASFDLALDIRLLDYELKSNLNRPEALLREAFRKDNQVWGLGYGILADLRLFCAANDRVQPRETMTRLDDAQQRHLSVSYIQFVGVLDDISSSIANPAMIADAESLIPESDQSVLWTQKANLWLTYHYLRGVILERFHAAGYAFLLGLGDAKEALARRKLELAHDVLGLVTAVPFEALKYNGEAAVEKIRFVCANLLEVMETDHSTTITQKAHEYFTRLLDTLSRLDSKVSAKLVDTE